LGGEETISSTWAFISRAEAETSLEAALLSSATPATVSIEFLTCCTAAVICSVPALFSADSPHLIDYVYKGFGLSIRLSSL
jgi:hypothetical protein